MAGSSRKCPYDGIVEEHTQGSFPKKLIPEQLSSGTWQAPVAVGICARQMGSLQGWHDGVSQELQLNNWPYQRTRPGTRFFTGGSKAQL